MDVMLVWLAVWIGGGGGYWAPCVWILSTLNGCVNDRNEIRMIKPNINFATTRAAQKSEGGCT